MFRELRVKLVILQDLRSGTLHQRIWLLVRGCNCLPALTSFSGHQLPAEPFYILVTALLLTLLAVCRHLWGFESLMSLLEQIVGAPPRVERS